MSKPSVAAMSARHRHTVRLNALFTDLVATTPRARPHFAWGILHAAHLAKALKIDRISAIEFGVAGGNEVFCRWNRWRLPLVSVSRSRLMSTDLTPVRGCRSQRTIGTCRTSSAKARLR